MHFRHRQTDRRTGIMASLKTVSLQPSSEQSIGDVRITQLDRKWVSQTRTSCCRSSVTVTAECVWHHASWNIGWQTAKSTWCCRTRGSNRQPSREAPAQTITGGSSTPLWTEHARKRVANGIPVVRNIFVTSYYDFLVQLATVNAFCKN